MKSKTYFPEKTKNNKTKKNKNKKKKAKTENNSGETSKEPKTCNLA